LFHGLTGGVVYSTSTKQQLQLLLLPKILDSRRLSNIFAITATAVTTTTISHHTHTHTHTTVSRPFFRDHPGEPVPEENLWTLWCKGRLTEADTLTIRLGATPSGLTIAYLHHPLIFFTGRMPFLPPNQQCQSTEQQIKITYFVIKC